LTPAWVGYPLDIVTDATLKKLSSIDNKILPTKQPSLDKLSILSANVFRWNSKRSPTVTSLIMSHKPAVVFLAECYEFLPSFAGYSSYISMDKYKNVLLLHDKISQSVEVIQENFGFKLILNGTTVLYAAYYPPNNSYTSVPYADVYFGDFNLNTNTKLASLLPRAYNYSFELRNGKRGGMMVASSSKFQNSWFEIFSDHQASLSVFPIKSNILFKMEYDIGKIINKLKMAAYTGILNLENIRRPVRPRIFSGRMSIYTLSTLLTTKVGQRILHDKFNIKNTKFVDLNAFTKERIDPWKRLLMDKERIISPPYIPESQAYPDLPQPKSKARDLNGIPYNHTINIYNDLKDAEMRKKLVKSLTDLRDIRTKVLAIRKSSKVKDVLDTRGISLLPEGNRIFENLLLKVKGKMEKETQRIHPQQYAFMKNKSSTELIINLSKTLKIK